MTTQDKRKAIREVLAQLDKENRLTPDEVISEGQKPDSPLHSEFTWDVAEAARITWVNQARALISSFTVTRIVNHREYNVQEFVEHPTKPEREQGYVSIDKIKSNRMMAREFIERELTMASAYVSRTRDYATILGLTDRVDSVTRDLDELRNDVHKAEDHPNT